VIGEHILGWAQHTTGKRNAVFCAGDHYFMEVQSDLLVKIVSDTFLSPGGVDMAAKPHTHP